MLFELCPTFFFCSLETSCIRDSYEPCGLDPRSCMYALTVVQEPELHKSMLLLLARAWSYKVHGTIFQVTWGSRDTFRAGRTYYSHQKEVAHSQPISHGPNSPLNPVSCGHKKQNRNRGVVLTRARRRNRSVLPAYRPRPSSPPRPPIHRFSANAFFFTSNVLCVAQTFSGCVRLEHAPIAVLLRTHLAEPCGRYFPLHR